MRIRIDFVGTEAFYNNWSPDPGDKARSIRNYCEKIWKKDVEDKSNHQFLFKYWDQNNVKIDGSAFQTEIVGLRLRSQWGWLTDNWVECSNSDSIVVIDYCQDPQLGDSFQASAGSKNYYIAMVNTRPEDSNPAHLDPFSGSEPVAQHELCHLFSSDHPDDVSLNGSSEASLMYSPQDQPNPFGCSTPSDYNGNPGNFTVGDWHSSCAKKSVHSYLNSTYP